MTRSSEASLLVGVLLASAIASWWLLLRPVVDYDARAFDALPVLFNGWRAVDVEMDQSVSEMLNADHNVQRVYLHPLGYQVFVYVGYYGTRRGGTPEHTPDVCYPAQGWSILDSSRHRIGGDAGFDVQEFVVEKDGEQRLVHFWYRTATTTGLTSILALRLTHFWSRLTEDRGDGALVRLSTPVLDGDVEEARARLFGLDSVLEAAVGDVWPQQARAPAESTS